MSKLDKKQRHKAKRQAKRLATRKRLSISPLKVLAESKNPPECWISDGFHKFNQSQIFVYKSGAGRAAIACFLVDRGVVGLKDAYTVMGTDRAQLEEMLEAGSGRGIRMHRATIEEVRKRIAGGLRWAHNNGMRLPKDWVKTASLIGGVGDWASADVSEFVMQFGGHPEDLRQRLIGQPFEDYIRRTDIAFILSEDAPYMDQETGRYSNDEELFDGEDDYDDEEDENEDDESQSIVDALTAGELDKILGKFSAGAAALAEKTKIWLESRGKKPAGELFEAWRSVLMASMLSKLAMPDGPDEESAEFGYELLQDFSGRIEESLAEEYHSAVGQVLEHLQTDSTMMSEAILEHGFGDQSPGTAAES